MNAIMEKNEVRICENMLNKLGQLKKRLPINKEIIFRYSTEMSHQCLYFQNYSDLLSLLQCQSATDVTIVLQLHIKKKLIVKTASEAVIPRPR